MLFNLDVHKSVEKAIEFWKKTHQCRINQDFPIYSTLDSKNKKWWKVNNQEIPDFENRGYLYEGQVKDFDKTLDIEIGV